MYRVIPRRASFVVNIVLSNYILGSKEEYEVAGFFVFSHIWMMGYFRLG